MDSPGGPEENKETGSGSGKLLLALASTVNLCFHPVGALSKSPSCFEMGSPLRLLLVTPLYWGVNRAGTHARTHTHVRESKTNIKLEVHLYRIQTLSSYLTGNTLRLHSNAQPVNAV
jgi:hypothetical protein